MDINDQVDSLFSYYKQETSILNELTAHGKHIHKCITEYNILKLANDRKHFDHLPAAS